MSTDAPKPWDKPWTTQDLIDQASDWNLAGDVGLLRHLEQLSETIITKCNETHNNLDKLLANLDESSLRLDVVKNEFFGLHNTQFIESRVYEEDETLPEETERKKPQEKVVGDDDRRRDVKEALQIGLDVLDKYFDKIEVSVSDSEDDTNIPSYVLKPKDLYIDRPLPYVIGTEEWYKKVHVGLEETSSESEIDKISEKFSESDSESELPISTRSQVKAVSDTSSEDFSNKIISDHPIANSTLGGVGKSDFVASSDSDGTNSLPAQAPISNATFAEQLAAKLGNVIEKVSEEEVNTKPIQKGTNKTNFGGLFFDEPPPLDESDDLFDDTTKKGLFSTTKGLFDDDDDDDWEQKQPETKQSVVKPIDSLTDNTDKAEKVPKKEALAPNIFDDDFSDDDLFDTSKKSDTKKPYLQPFKTAPPIFDDEPPALESEPMKKKKPVGGVAVLSQNLFDDIRKVIPDTKRGDDDKNDTNRTIVPSNEKKTLEGLPKKISLFDDDADDSFNITNKVDDESKDKTEQVRDESSKAANKNVDENKTKENTTDGKPTLGKSTKISLFDDDFDDNLFEHDLFSDASIKKFTSSLFDDEPLRNDLFSPGNITQNQTKDESTKKSVDNPTSEVTTKKEETPTKTVSLFDSNPPPDLDDDWDTKSDNNLFDDEPLSYDTNDYSRQPISLFDNEPPLLFSDESSGIVKDQTRGGSDVSFVPEASSSRRLSSDIFSEQQSNDSFFLTKNTSEQPLQAPLGSISEVPSDGDSSRKETNGTRMTTKSLFLFEDDDLEDNLFVSEDKKETTNNTVEDTKETIKTVDADTKSATETNASVQNGTPPKGTASPGKLKHNLNINVEALRPGFSPPKKDTVKANSLDVVGDDVNDQEKSVRFEEIDDSIKTLHSYTKDRVRIPVKRRPSSRRGRKELMKKSSDDFKIEDDNEDDSSPVLDESLLKKVDSDVSEKAQNATTDTEIQKIVTEVAQNYLKSTKNSDANKTPIEPIRNETKTTNSANMESHLFSGSDDDDDLFGTKISKPTLMTAPKKDTNVLFDSPDSDSDLFGPPPKEPPTKNLLSITETKERRPSVVKSDDFATPEFNKPELFTDDNDDDDDIFSTKKLPPKSNILKKSLFGDDPDDDDDIFSTVAPPPKNTKKTEHPPKKTPSGKTSGLKKLDNSATLDDPLEALKK